jgi:GxxExxY protein
MSPSPSARASSSPKSANSYLNKKEKRFTAKDAKDAQRTRRVTEEQIGHAIIGAAIKVDSIVGPGLLESAYETCLLYELEKHNLPVRRQVMIPMRCEDLTIDNGYRVDLLVGEQILVELKAVEAILPVHRGQLLSYLRLGGFRLGYLLNFHVVRMRDGVVRMVNGI